ncbi:MAG: SRPBCC domain-containing protein [Gammaproteobacteria bacterium]|jgi:uncharacterized protein YndB with AHSA1/START domain
MATIYHQVGIKSPLNAVYQAIATPDGVSGWWTETRGSPVPGGELAFDFDGHIVKVTVTENVPGKYVEWTVGGEEGEWLDTRICFELDEREDQIMVNFQHADWKAATPFMSHCSTKWAVFMLSLKDYLETGTGKPFPHDTPINHTDFN